MRRAPIVLTSTIVGLAAVLGFKPRAPSLPTAPASSTTASPTTASPSGSSSKASSSSSKASGSSSKASSSGTKTVTGDAIATQYGNAQVRVTISGGKITNVEALQLQGNDPKSVQISGTAEPYLRQSALTKQSAQIDAVSGATFTSASYAQSLQSALDKAGFKTADGSRASAVVPQEGRGGRGGGPGGVRPDFAQP
ncbi:MAG: FMN-binding protein [Solirubrobacterales bacterium]|nr:FMN-binding protein [Solirubrobacterales bacterium]